MIVGFDFDEVLYRFTKTYHLWMNLSKGMNLDPEKEADSWEWFEDWQTREEFLAEMDNSVDAGHLFWTGELYEPTIAQNIRDLKAAGHQVIAITNRFSGKTRCSKKATVFWAAKNSLEFDCIIFSPDKTVVRTDYFIEDNLKNYDALDAVGTCAYLINRPHNLENDSRRRVNTVDEFTRIVLGGQNVPDRYSNDSFRDRHLSLQRK